jgi:hypothetical protein
MMAFITLSLLILYCKGSADATPLFSVTRVGQIVCFGNNTFDIDAPEDGKLVITIRNNTSVFRTIEGTVSAGKSSIEWDGLGYNRERLTPMTYHIDSVLTGETGNQYEVHFDSPIELCKQALLFALPSAETAYLNDPDGWFFECRAVTGGTLKIQFLQEEAEKILYEFERDIAPGRISRITLKSILGKKRIEPGVYLIRVYDITASDYTSEFMLHVEEEKPEEEAVFVTGPIMPENGADDEAGPDPDGGRGLRQGVEELGSSPLTPSFRGSLSFVHGHRLCAHDRYLPVQFILHRHSIISVVI